MIPSAFVFTSHGAPVAPHWPNRCTLGQPGNPKNSPGRTRFSQCDLEINSTHYCPSTSASVQNTKILLKGGEEAEPVNSCFFFFFFSLTISADLAPVVLTPDEEEYSVVEGKAVTMRCEVFSSPPPDIYW